LVVGVYAGFIETDMVARLNVPKIRPEEVTAKTMEALLTDQEEVLADGWSQEVKAALASDTVAFYRQIQESWERSKREEAKHLSQEE
jgi:hypothetical protein